jgi:uncharacterized protein YcfJ
MTPEERMTFFKTAGISPTALGAVGGGFLGAGIQGTRLAKKGKEGLTQGQRRLRLSIAKQKLEVRANPSPRNYRKLKELEVGYRVATYLSKHPALATAGSVGAGALIGGMAGRRIGKL